MLNTAIEKAVDAGDRFIAANGWSLYNSCVYEGEDWSDAAKCIIEKFPDVARAMDEHEEMAR